MKAQTKKKIARVIVVILIFSTIAPLFVSLVGCGKPSTNSTNETTNVTPTVIEEEFEFVDITDYSDKQSETDDTTVAGLQDPATNQLNVQLFEKLKTLDYKNISIEQGLKYYTNDKLVYTSHIEEIFGNMLCIKETYGEGNPKQNSYDSLYKRNRRTFYIRDTSNTGVGLKFIQTENSWESELTMFPEVELPFKLDELNAENKILFAETETAYAITTKLNKSVLREDTAASIYAELISLGVEDADVQLTASFDKTTLGLLELNLAILVTKVNKPIIVDASIIKLTTLVRDIELPDSLNTYLGK